MVTTTYVESTQSNGRGAANVDPKEKSFLAAKAALDKKASNLVIFEVGEFTTIADYFIICSAQSRPQIRAIQDHIEKTLSKEGEHFFSVEGEGGSGWVLMDYSDLIVHIFMDDVRSFYALERLWGDAPQLEPKEKPVSARSQRSGKAIHGRPARRYKRAGGL